MFSVMKYQYSRTSSSRFTGSKNIISASLKLLLLIMAIGCAIKFSSGRFQKIIPQSTTIVSAVNDTKSGLGELSLGNSSAELSPEGIESYVSENLKAVERVFVSGIR